MPDSSTKKLVLIDGHALAYRMYFALSEARFSTRQGEPTNATYGFIRTLLTLLGEADPPDYLAVSFDVGRTFRDDLFEEYKGTREKMPDRLQMQIERIQELLEAFNIPVLVETPEGSLTKQATEAVVTYHVAVYNNGTHCALTLNELVDDQVGGGGSITSLHDNLVGTDCAVPQTIAVEGDYSCTFKVRIASPGSDAPITNTVSAAGVSNNPMQDPFLFQGVETVQVDLDVPDPE